MGYVVVEMKWELLRKLPLCSLILVLISSPAVQKSSIFSPSSIPGKELIKIQMEVDRESKKPRLGLNKNKEIENGSNGKVG